MSTDFEMPVADKKPKSKVATMTETKAEVSSPQTDDEPVPEKSKYTPDELLRVFDDMLFAGEYTESYNIRGKLKITFKTRSAEEMDSITKQIDATSATLMATMVEKRNLLNLYHALSSYQGKDLRLLKIEDRISFINKLPAPIVGMLMVTLYEFDMKVQEATKEGEANF